MKITNKEFGTSRVTFNVFIFSSIFVIIMIVTANLSTSLTEGTIANNIHHTTSCNCVVFRLDGIQADWIEQGQITIMDLFLSKNQSLVLGIIMDGIENDTKIFNKVREGQQKGLFELALHGWSHENYSKLNEKDQLNSFKKSNEKMKYLFGNSSKIFSAPYDEFNGDTLKVMDRVGIGILSSMLYKNLEYDHDHNVSSIFNMYENNEKNDPPYNIPGTVGYKILVNNSWIATPMNMIMEYISKNTEKYGYAVINLHPQDIIIQNKTGELSSMVNKTEVDNLSNLLNHLVSKNISIMSFSKLLEYYNEPQIHQLIAAKQQ